MKIKTKPKAIKLVAAVLSFLMINSVLPFFAVTASAASITPTTPQKDTSGVYQIGTAAELYGFAQLVNNGETSANAVLTADITVNDSLLISFKFDENKNVTNGNSFESWTPIGNDPNKYTGKFDGQGHTVSGLYFNNTNTNFVGLFGYLAENGEIKNVGLIDSYFNAGHYVGGVCGYNYGTITGCYSTGKVSGTGDYVGGVCGRNYNGTITGCCNTGKVSGNIGVGGVCGRNYNGTIIGCYNTGKVSGTDYVGGVCGLNEGKTTGCYNTGTASGSSKNVGGVCGYNNGTMTGCYTNSGGVYGHNYKGTVTDCVEYTGNEFKDGTVCTLLNTALQNANASVIFYQGVKSPEFIRSPQHVNKVYLIGTAAELYAFAQIVNDGETSASAVLTADITMNSGLLSSLKFDENKNVTNGNSFESWTPIGNYSDRYTGKFDGQGHTVSGLYFNNKNTDNVGLFGYLAENGEIKNIGVIDSYFNGRYGVGGVCGRNYGTITGCYNTGKVSGNIGVGGVCGYNYAGTITGCYNTGKVSGSGKYVGGVCGCNASDGTITGCYNTGTVSGDSEVGGVCGYNNGTITGCYNTGKVSGDTRVGGVCGDNENGNISGKITGCYNTGTISGSGNYVGGVCGYNYVSKITGCYTNNGGVYGYDFHGTLTDCVEYTGDEFINGTVCTLLNTALKNENSDVRFYQGANYPKLCVIPKSVNGVYQIGTEAELYWFADKINNDNANYGNAKAVLTADIVVNTGVLKDDGNVADDTSSFTSWTPIGWYDYNNEVDYSYTGTFDGQGHIISGLYFNNENTGYVGLFGYLNSGGEIKNVGVIDFYFKGNRYVGGVCGNNYKGTITGCYNTGTVSGSNDVGGVCGCNEFGTITGCYNTGTVSGDSFVGGVCAENRGTITGCYNIGTVSGTNIYIGGVCGLNDSTITDCYNTGTVSGSNDYVGGVCGDNGGTMTDCYNTGTVSGSNDVGGVCGQNTIRGTITGCYNTGAVSGTNHVGGVCGENKSGKITGCYNTGTVSGKNNVGGVCGSNSGTMTGCYTNNAGVCGVDTGTAINCVEYTGDEFKDGTVCKLLNTALKNANYEVRFCQRIGTDASPLLTYQFESVDEHTYGVYRCENNTFKATCFCEQKSEKTMELTLKTDKTVVANGADNTLTATLSNYDNEAVTYKWYQNDVLIQNATSSTYKMPNDLAIGTHTYKVEVTMANVGTITQSVDVLVDITPQYYVEIPASVNIGDSFTVSASNVLLKNNAQLKVGIESDFTLSTPKGSLLNYEILNNSVKLTSGDTLLTVAGSENPTAPGSGTSDTYNVALAQGEKPKYSGNYTDTLTFTIKVEQ